MPFRIQHGPISSALRLAQQAGAGQEFWRRHAAEQQMVANVHRRRQVERELSLRERSQDIQAALSMATLQQREAASQRQVAAQEAATGATRDLALRRELRAERGGERAVAGERAERREARLTETAQLRQERIEADPTKNYAYVRTTAAIRTQEDLAESLGRQAKSLEKPMPGGGMIIPKASKERWRFLKQEQGDAEQQLQNLLDARTMFLNNAMPQYEAAQAAAAAAAATAAKPAGAMEGKGQAVTIGGQVATVPAPPKHLTAPYSGANLSQYPNEGRQLKSFYLDFLNRKIGRETVLADFENARRGYFGYAQRQGWSLQ